MGVQIPHGKGQIFGENGRPIVKYRGAHWRHLKNTTEPSMCGGDAVLCQITLTTCYYYFILRLSLCVSTLDVVTVTLIAGPCG